MVLFIDSGPVLVNPRVSNYDRHYLILQTTFIQVASELNAAILKAELAEHTQPRLATVLKLLLWAQGELDKKGIRYNRMTDLATGRTEDSK